MNPSTWTDDERRAFWVSLWANAALAAVLIVVWKRGG